MDTIIEAIAVLAMLVNGDAGTSFERDTLANCTPVMTERFIGCEDRRFLPDNDASYAGIIIEDGRARLITGP